MRPKDNGRPIGVRNAFSTAFLTPLGDVWAEHGKGTMIRCARCRLKFS